jgi:hypothetical protein
MKEYDPTKCRFVISWAGQCQKPPAEGIQYCDEHKSKRCVVCGDQAIHDCSIAVSLVCGSPLCGNPICRRRHLDFHNNRK